MKENALKLFDKRINCAQAIVCAYGECYGLTQEQCLKIAASFGGGIGKSAKHLCGIINGALMIIGLHDSPNNDDKNKRDSMNKKIRQFMTELENNHPSLFCKDILKENNEINLMHSNKCRDFLIEVCNALDKLLV